MALSFQSAERSDYLFDLKRAESSRKSNASFDWFSSTKVSFSLIIDWLHRFCGPGRPPPRRPLLTYAGTINVILKNRFGKKQIDLVIRKQSPIGPRPLLTGIDVWFAS